MRRSPSKFNVFQAICVTGLMFVAAPAFAQSKADIESMLKFLPAQSNSVSVLRIEQILQTKRAQDEGWVKRRDKVALDTIPKWVRYMVLASEFHPAGNDEEWTVAVVPKVNSISLANIAKEQGVEIQTIGETPAMLSSRGVYVADFSDEVMGVYMPAYRQAFGRWVRSVKSNRGTGVTEYLDAAAKRPAHVVFAVDLLDTFDPNILKQWIQVSGVMKNDELRIPEVVELLQSLRGVTLTIIVGGTNSAKLNIDFGQSPALQKKFIKPILLELLGEQHLMLDEVADAKEAVSGNSFELDMSLSDSSFRHIVSVIVAPHPESSAKEQSADATTPPDTTEVITEPQVSATYEASQQYLQSVITVMEDLERMNNKAKNAQQTARWYDNAAKRLDNLPARGVDKKLLEYGVSLGAHLRAIAASLRGTDLDVKVQQETLTYSYKVQAPQYGGWGGAWGGWGGGGWRPPTVNWNSNLKNIRENQAKAVSAGSKQREQIWGQIKNEFVAIKLTMRNEFGDDFIEGLDDKKRRR